MSGFTQSIYYEQCIRPHLLIFEFMYFHALHHAFILFIVLLDIRLGHGNLFHEAVYTLFLN